MAILIQNQDLLSRLKQMVTTKQTPNMMNATGIPPHILQGVELQHLLRLSTEILEKVMEQNNVICTSIYEAIEHHAVNKINITSTHLTQILDLFKADLKEDVRAQLQELHSNGFGRNEISNNTGNVENTNNNPPTNSVHRLYWYAIPPHDTMKAWHVPHDFTFPEDTKQDVGF